MAEIIRLSEITISRKLDLLFNSGSEERIIFLKLKKGKQRINFNPQSRNSYLLLKEELKAQEAGELFYKKFAWGEKFKICQKEYAKKFILANKSCICDLCEKEYKASEVDVAIKYKKVINRYHPLRFEVESIEDFKNKENKIFPICAECKQYWANINHHMYYPKSLEYLKLIVRSPEIKSQFPSLQSFFRNFNSPDKLKAFLKTYNKQEFIKNLEVANV